MSLNLYLVFIVSAMFISATPGPNMLLAFSHGIRFGLRRTLFTLLGLTSGLLILLILSLFGVAAISHSSPILFQIFKSLGALYLMYLGIKMLQSKGNQQITDKMDYIVPSPIRLYKMGLAVSLSNPKAILFFAAFFPKFIDVNKPALGQLMILSITCFVIETFWQLIYAGSGKILANWLQVNNRLLWLDRICGIIFILTSVSLLSELTKFFH